METLARVLAEHEFLKDLTPEQIAFMTGCAANARFEPGSYVIREGESADRMYLLRAGRVLLEVNVPGSGPLEVESLEPGDVLGWSWLFPPYCWHFAARALTPTKAIFFYGTWLRERCDQDPKLGLELMKRVTAVIVRRLQTTRQRLGRALRAPVV